MFAAVERLRQQRWLSAPATFVGYFYLAMWNHLFSRVPLYWFRHLVARACYGLKLGPGSNLHRSVFLLSPWHIHVGEGSNVQMGCFLDGRGGLTIGSNVDLTPGVRVLTEQHDIDSPGFDTVKRPVRIHDHAVIGSWALIMPGVTIGEGAVVAAGAVVTKDVAPYTMVAGNPAVPKRQRARDLRYRVAYRRPFH